MRGNGGVQRRRKIIDGSHTGLSAHECIRKLFGNLGWRATMNSHTAVSV